MLCFLKISNIPTKQKANKFSGFLADMNLLAFLVPWRQTKTHGQYFIGNLELKNHPNPHNLKWKTVSQFLIGKVERIRKIQLQPQIQARINSLNSL